MGKPSAPKPQDPAALAQAQAEANRVSTFSPFGDVLFGSVGDDGGFLPSNGNQAAVQINPTDLQTSTLGLQQQTENQIAQQLSDRVGSLPTGSIDLSGLPDLRTDFSQQGQELEQATFQRAMGLLDPRMNQREDQLRSNLAVRGLPTGSEAADTELSLFNQDRRELELSAALDAISAGRNEQSRQFNMTQSARDQGISEQSFLRNQPFNELAAAMSGSQLNQFQGNSAGAPGVDVVGPAALQQQAQLAAFNQQNDTNSGLLGGLFSLGSAALPSLIAASDRRLKTDIHRIGELDNGVPLYRFRYRGLEGEHVGVMADEVEHIPGAVIDDGQFKKVDYGKVIHA